MLLFKKKNLNILDFLDVALEEYKRLENLKWQTDFDEGCNMYDYLAQMFGGCSVGRNKKKHGKKGKTKRYAEEDTEIHFYLDVSDKNCDQTFYSLEDFDLSITNLNLDVDEATTMFILNNNIVHCTILPFEEKCEEDNSTKISYRLIASNTWQNLINKCDKLLDEDE